MLHLVGTPAIKKKFCNHEYRKFNSETNPIYVCIWCHKRKKIKPRQQKISNFIQPAFKPSVPDYVKEHKFLSNWEEVEHDGWKFPATKEPHDKCGLWQTKGCLHVEDHKTSESKNKVFVKQYKWSCFRPSCKECYPKWIGRQANRSTRRIEEYEKISGKRPRHVILSVPKWKHKLSEKEIRKEAYEILKSIHCFGGAIVFHPFRCDNLRNYYYFPHYHVVGFGRIRGITKSHNRRGWYIKSMGRRKSTFHTFHYLLSHCGIKKNHHSVTWFGDLNYSKLKLEKEPDFTICPSCGRKLVPIYYEGVHSVVPPDQVFEGFVDSWDWYEVETIPKSEWTKSEKYEYALERELYVANSGISFSN